MNIDWSRFKEIAHEQELYLAYWECDTCADQMENIQGVDDPIDWTNEPCGFCRNGQYLRVTL